MDVLVPTVFTTFTIAILISSSRGTCVDARGHMF